MLIPSEDKRPKEPDLPLDTDEQIEYSHKVNDAREHCARARIVEGEADAIEIENDHARFRLARDRIYLTVGLILLFILMACGVCLWVYGERAGGLYVFGSSGILGGAGAIARKISPQ